MTRLRFSFLLGLALLAPGLILWAQDNESCLACHGQNLDGIPPVHSDSFTKSIHGKNLCTSCHQDAQEIPHAPKLAPVSCKSCHRLEASIYLESDHGKALSRGQTEAATCTSCHGDTHTLLSSRDPRSPIHRKNIPKTCATCHADQHKMAQIKLSEREPFDTYEHSVHGEALKAGKINAAVCSDCHGTHDIHASSNQLSKINRAKIPETCGKCHENIRDVYRKSVHGTASRAGIKESPVCTDCHGEHTIRAMKDMQSSVYVGAITKTCARCHASETINSKFNLPKDRLASYQDSYHGLAARLGDVKAANCASCHGWHDVLPSSDPRASTHHKNLPMTCGKCHEGISQKMPSGPIHGSPSETGHHLVRFFTIFYLILIPLVIGFLFMHNLADYIRKTISGPNPAAIPDHEAHAERLNKQERLQHAVLMITFTVLAFSGFALKYPDTWWAAPFEWGGELFRKGMHRGTAVLFTLTFFWHVYYMLFTRRGRFLLFSCLFPRKRDLSDPKKLVAYNLGLSGEKPRLRYPSYIEKVEYWALVWGSVVMMVTGGLLIFNTMTMRVFGTWMTDLATAVHFYEAILATLAILVWHFYWTIFDPDVYPMNLSWLIGTLRRRFKRRKKDGHER